MGKVDTVTKAYMRKNNFFADAFNYLIYDGKPVVNPEQLRELDTTEIALPFGLRENEKGPSNDLVQKYRDILKSAVVMQEWIYRCGETACPDDRKPRVRA